MAGPVWSIILASRNGEDTLPRCLSALTDVVTQKDDVEILLVDNASDDATRDLIEEAGAGMAAQIISEPRAGKAYALNSAIEKAKGQWLLFIDDDVLVNAHWLAAYQSAASASPEASLLAGAIRPEWDARPPAWLAAMAERGKACGCTDPAAPAGPYPAQQVKGGNFAIRRNALGTTRFDEGASNLGGSARRPTGGLDTRIAGELARIDGGIVHVPAAMVRHIISVEEMVAGAVFSRQRRIGRNYAAAHHPRLADLAKSAVKVVVFGAAIPVAALAQQPQILGRCILGAATHWGRLEHWLF